MTSPTVVPSVSSTTDRAMRTHVARRFGRIAYTLLSVAVAVGLGSAALLVTGKDPIKAYATLLQGAVGSSQAVMYTLVTATPLLLAGLAVAMSFQAGVFNIGAGGQVAMGALAAAVVGGYLHIWPPLVMVLMVVTGGLAGAVWGSIAGLLRATTGASEVITTLMLNYVAVYLLDYLVTGPLKAPGTINQTPPIPVEARFPAIVPGTQLTIALPMALMVTGAVWFLLRRTQFGFELRMVGRNPEAARAAGMPVNRVIVLTMGVSGFIAGLAGVAQVGGVLYSLPQDFSIAVGFDAIAVSLLGANEPLGVLLAGLFLGGLSNGSVLMEAVAGVSGPFIEFLEAIMIAVIAAPAGLRWARLQRAARSDS